MQRTKSNQSQPALEANISGFFSFFSLPYFGSPIHSFTHHDVREGQVEVGVLDEPLGVEGLVLPDLPGDEEADGGEELQLAPLE